MNPVSVHFLTERGFGGVVAFQGYAVTCKHAGCAYREQVVKLTEEKASEYYGHLPHMWEKFQAAKNAAGLVVYFN
jgi:hypothetical protein